MNITPSSDRLAGLTDPSASSADQALQSTQHRANEALDKLSHGAQQLQERGVPALQRASDQAHALAQRGVDAAREGSTHLRQRATQLSDGTVEYIQKEPLKSVLIAAAAGAALVALLNLLRRPGA